MFDRLKQRFPLGEAKWNEYAHLFKQMQMPAKTILLREGEIARKLFVVERGCLRVWLNNKGKDVTLQFIFESGMVASLESFRKGLPSPISIEAIEPSVVWWIHKKDFDIILAEIIVLPELRDQFIAAVFERTYDYMNLFFSFLRDTPAQRYTLLLTHQPHIIKRIPQHYIASYLGISSVHLSRIKNKPSKK